MDPLTRRTALSRILIAAAAAALDPPRLALALADRSSRPLSGRLALHNIHTGESLNVQYADPATGRLDPEATRRLDRLFRCHHTDEVCVINRDLYRLLDSLQTELQADGNSYQLVSGYRSETYNRILRSRSRNVAGRSYHLSGMAADVWLQGVPVERLREAAVRRSRGGVGYYRDFLHVDVGPVRNW